MKLLSWIALLLSLLWLCHPKVAGQNISPASSVSSCSYSFPEEKKYARCLSLPVLGCHLHWTYDALAGTAEIAFRATGVDTKSSSGNWVAWALNPTGSGMAGAQSLVAYTNSNGEMRAYTSSVESAAITTLYQSKLSFNVSDLTAESSENQIIIYATVKLPGDRTIVNHVWQVGPLSDDGSPGMHELNNAHQSSQDVVDFSTGIALPSGGGNSRLNPRKVHGMINMMAWGLLMPIGAMIARYLKVLKSADSAWFYLHFYIQSTAYLAGIVGCGTGLKLGHDSKGITYYAHRNIGIALLVMATLQVIVARIRPNKEHKARIYWNLFHWSVGYLVIVLGIINVFKGLDIVRFDRTWMYTVLIIVLGCIALFLEALTWIVVLRRKKNDRVVPDFGS